MKDILREIIYRFYTRSIPALTKRTCHFPVVEGRATVILGMRRSKNLRSEMPSETQYFEDKLLQ